MVPVGTPDPADPLQRVLVADVATERIAGVGGIGDHPARAHDLDCAPDEPRLGILRMQIEVLDDGHLVASDGVSARSAMIRGPAGVPVLFVDLPRMQALLELLPLVAFIVAYKMGDIYIATIALMAAMAVLLAVDWVRSRRVPPLHGISAALVFGFGALTLLLHDQRFIQWKPTVFFWAVGIAFLASQWLGERPLAQRLMSAALGESAGQIARTDWLRLNLAWVGFYALMGAANLAVVSRYSENTWVNFKVYGITAATLGFVVAQSVWLSRRAPGRESDH